MITGSINNGRRLSLLVRRFMCLLKNKQNEITNAVPYIKKHNKKMVTIVDDLDSLCLQEPIFKDVKYYLSGDVTERVCFFLLFTCLNVVFLLFMVAYKCYFYCSCRSYNFCSRAAPKTQSIYPTM